MSATEEAMVHAELVKARDSRSTVAVTTRAGETAAGMVEALTATSVTLAERGSSYRTTRLVLLAEVAIVEVSW